MMTPLENGSELAIGPTTPVGRIAAECAASLPYFEEKGVVYVNGGEDSLQEACRKADLGLPEALATLSDLQGRGDPGPHWERRPLSALVAHLVANHHAFTRAQIERVDGLLAETVRTFGFKHPQLIMLKELFLEMAGEMRSHMSREEELLFPYLVGREEAEGTAKTIPNPFMENPFFRQPLRVLSWEHRMTGEEWTQVRLLTNDFLLSPEAAPLLRSLYSALLALEEDLHRHVHLENNVLFKRAIERGWVQ